MCVTTLGFLLISPQSPAMMGAVKHEEGGHEVRLIAAETAVERIRFQAPEPLHHISRRSLADVESIFNM